jgi:hypothetical protein
MSLDERHRNTSWNSSLSAITRTDSPPHPGDDTRSTPPASAPLTRHNSGEEPSGSNTPPEHLDFPEISELSKVPSYQTAVKTPVSRPLVSEGFALPDYRTALSAPSSQPGTPRISPVAPSIADSLETITEPAQEVPPISIPVPTLRESSPPPSQPRSRRQTLAHRRQFSSGFLHNVFHMAGEGDEGRRLHLLQARSG